GLFDDFDQFLFAESEGELCVDIPKEFGYPRGFIKLDFYIPALKLNIEFDGTYWHSSDWKKGEDTLRDSILPILIPGVKIIRVKERYFDS
ncbi:hypothetical protein ABK046_47170, partial [Streptomyces caeruleatus]